jgi:hypothetical protein
MTYIWRSELGIPIVLSFSGMILSQHLWSSGNILLTVILFTFKSPAMNLIFKSNKLYIYGLFTVGFVIVDNYEAIGKFWILGKNGIYNN